MISNNPQSLYSPPLPLPKSDWPNHKIIGYYATNDVEFMEPSAIPWPLLTHVIFAFASIGSDYAINITGKDALLSTICSSALSNGVNPVLSIGGWGSGSSMFSSMAASATARANFIGSLRELVDQFKLTGVDIDWEYPGEATVPGVPFNATTDFANLFLLFKGLREEFGNEITISAAVDPSNPFTDHIPDMVPIVDWFGLMVIDETVGFGDVTSSNAPLGGPGGGAEGVRAWNASGLPTDKMVFGVPSEGRNFTLLDVCVLRNQTNFCQTPPLQVV